MNIVKATAVLNPCYRAGRTITPKGLMLHSVGCPQPNASVFVRNWNDPSAQVCVHAVLQADGTVYQMLPWHWRGWHGGGSSNNTHIGVEMTEPDCIRYTHGSTFTCSDWAAATNQVRGTYNTAVELFAYLCDLYKLNPLTDICSHAEGYKKGIASNHGDPDHLWKQLGLSYTMDTFRADVKAAMSGVAVETNSPTASKKDYSATVEAWQRAAIADGYSFPKYGADGVWGSECEAVAAKAIVRQRDTYKNKNLTKFVQRAIGMTGDDIDGLCGTRTTNAIRAFQYKNGHILTVDGCVGPKTWRVMLNV